MTLLETVTEPPYGWWPDRPDEFVDYENERIVPDNVTDLDVAGDVTVTCSDCGNTDLSAEMIDQLDGEFLCVACDNENFREWQDYMNERWKR